MKKSFKAVVSMDELKKAKRISDICSGLADRKDYGAFEDDIKVIVTIAVESEKKGEERKNEKGGQHEKS